MARRHLANPDLSDLESERFIVLCRVWGQWLGFRRAIPDRACLQNANPDFVLHTGDIIYTSFTAALADTRCLSVYAPHMKSTPYFFAIGNHDLLAGAQHLARGLLFADELCSNSGSCGSGDQPGALLFVRSRRCAFRGFVYSLREPVQVDRWRCAIQLAD